MKLTVLHVITSLELGGAESMLLKLIKQFQSRRDQEIANIVLVLKRPQRGMTEQFQAAGVPVFFLEINSPRFFRNFLGLKKKIAATPDLIQGWLPHGNILALLLQKILFRQARLFWNVRQSLHTWGTGSPLTRFLIQLGGHLSFLPEKIFFNSHTGARQHFQIGYQEKKGLVIPNGFEIDKIREARKQRPALRQKWGIHDEQLALIHVGRFDPTKDHETFFQATIELLKNQPSLKIICVGRDVTFSNPEVAQQIPAELRHHYLLLDERQDVAELLAASDLYCSSSRAEAFANSIGEAMCAGLPCVVTDVGDSRFILQNDDYVVNAENSLQLSQALLKVCQLSTEQRRALGQQAFERVQAHFSIEAIAQTFLTQWGSP